MFDFSLDRNTMEIVASGLLDKMSTQLIDGKVEYSFTVFEPLPEKVPGTFSERHFKLNDVIGKPIKLSFLDSIECAQCFKKTKKSYGGGYCYPCSMKLAACDMCILKPETCHFAKGTCREPEWGEKNCNVDHIVYLANSSGLKVGITRASQVPTRFMDQGAIQALPIFRVQTRFHSGLVETLLSEELNDKTDWRKMLKGERVDIDLEEKRDEVFEMFADDLDQLEEKIGGHFEFLENEEVIDIEYPVLQYPEKVTSLSFEKTPVIEGILKGIKGQYLILDIGVINLRNHTSYRVKLEV